MSNEINNKQMKLTKKEIAKNVLVTRRSGFGNGFDYNATVRAFDFETLRDQPVGQLMEYDDEGHMAFVSYVENKKDVVNAIYEWFKMYSAIQFE